MIEPHSASVQNTVRSLGHPVARGELVLVDGTAISEEDCQRFFDQWKALAGAQIMPHTTDFLLNPEPGLISYVQILEMTENGQLVRFMGTGLVDLWGEDRTNQILGASLPEDLKTEFNRRVKTVIAHPCRLIEISTFASPAGRPFEMETVVLPLSVNEGRPPRVCSFRKIIDPLESKDSFAARYNSTHHQTWLDIGRGVPDTAPQSS